MWTTLALLIVSLFIERGMCLETVVRKNAEELRPEEVLALEKALHELQQDTSPNGYQALAAFHGHPANCDDGHGHKVACCLHGMPSFPMWHRLYVVQFERALMLHKSHISIPYWDWTKPLEHLPELVTNALFVDPEGGKAHDNSWYRGEITDIGERTARAVDDRLFEKVGPGQHSRLLDGILDALEQDEFCKFEIQFELAHNAIHYLVGGRHDYSMSHLEYTSYDPIFFLHHSNVDRIFAIWQRLQSIRGKDPNNADCAHNLIHNEMEPFNHDENTLDLTKSHARPVDTFDYSNLGYTYDDLSLNGMSPEQLNTYLAERHAREKFTASFRLSGFGGSANAVVYVCRPADDQQAVDHCEKAGDFFVLGGPTEMKWGFYRAYHYDVTETVNRFESDHHGNYYVKAELFSVNGTQLPSDLLPPPVLVHRLPQGQVDEAPHSVDESNLAIRKNINDLTREEVYELRRAMERFQEDTSVDGYQATVEFHGLPARCPRPDAANRFACCIHGMATFPHWHRLFVTQVEDALLRRGSPIGVPYWDWTRPMTHLPELAGNGTYVDPNTGETKDNPFHHAEVAFEGATTERQIDARLFEPVSFGHHSSLFNNMIYALEQDDFCDFEVQFEMTHNAIHAWIGGDKKYSMSSLHYTAFDPIFFLHHSNVDRIWAIWQALQIRRNKPFKAHCAMSLERQALKPFSFSSPLNNNDKTFRNAVPTDVYDYEGHLGYHYDDLQFGGMNLVELEEYIHRNQQHDRVFAGFFLSYIGTSANVEIFINREGEEPHKVGDFAVLGGSKEMKWGFDRMFKYDITEQVDDLHLDVHDGFSISVKITDVDGTELSADLIKSPALIFEPGHSDIYDHGHGRKIRKNVNDLGPEEVNAIRRAMEGLQEDKTAGGFQQIAKFHGEPKWCPSPEAERKFSCCVHGMATFPHWHRLLTVQAENALRKDGFSGALPYWDWTRPLSHLPELVDDVMYTDGIAGTEKHNPWHDGHIDSVGKNTTRSIRPELFTPVEFGRYTSIAEQVLLAFEQDNFCDFEVQFEIAHNFIHALVGGSDPYSMASLRYTTFDPIFYLHHSNTDRIWAIWQALQKYRGKPYNSANCAIASMRQPLQPFGLGPEVNPYPETHDHAVPFNVFDYKNNFDYEYDTLDFNGLSIAQLDRETQRRRAQDRVFAGFLLHGIKKSALVKFQICTSDTACHDAGEFYILGDEAEMPWQYDRLYKYEITHELEENDLHVGDRFFIKYEAFDLHMNSLGGHVFPQASVVHEPAAGSDNADEYTEAVTSASHIRRNLKDLSEGEIESLRSAFLHIQDVGTYAKIAEFHGKPAHCDHDGHKVACCVHGMPTFPHWHRLYVLQVENALLEQGSAVAVPYWDWVEAFDRLPDLINDATYFNSRSQNFEPNPFFSGKIPFENAVTTRDPQSKLFNNNYFYENVLLALEQDNFCDFEIQFEMVHNVLHSWLGGRATYSLSSLDYSAFDPVFFLHHANTDRLWAIWQELQRYRKKPYNEADCAINLMRVPLHPFDMDMNHDPMTKKYRLPADGYDYQNHFGYKYDNLEFNHFSIPKLNEVIQERMHHDRVFAGFLLHNIGTSADAEIYICVDSGHGEENCNNYAGSFTVLGGETEMPFTFDRLFKYDITHTLRDLGIKLDSHDFNLKLKLHGVNGSYLDPHVLPEPTIMFVPGEESHQEEDGHTEQVLVRREVASLSSQETMSLLRALTAMQHDQSPDGFQAIASFHALPPLCPEPSAPVRYACCLHGMATFPQWHRLYTVQFQDALKRHGAKTGIPYWDWLRPQTHLPSLVTMPTYHDPLTNEDLPNPFLMANIEFEGEGVHTEREIVSDHLYVKGEHIYDNWFFNQAIFALEQENYCDFEIQFEILHNGVHSWIGGSKTHSLGHLHYASYDPMFYIHHSQTDRIWAIWQALQKYRGLDGNEAHCALEQMREPLKPFSFGSPYNLNDHTRDFSKPEDTFDYHKFGYEYDSLEFVGMSVAELDNYITEHREEDRVFAGFLLKGFGDSASVNFKVCRADDTCESAGYFTVLGGSAEMPWQFDRLYKYDITNTLNGMHLRHDDQFRISVEVTSANGTVLGGALIPTPSVIFEPGHRDLNTRFMAPNRVRHELSDLTERDLKSLKSAMRELQNDNSENGYQAIAAFHGLPAGCHDAEGNEIACCIHGMPTFPHWHRLYTLQMEQALRRHGSTVAIPYWDWTKPIHNLPELFTSPEYYDVWQDAVVNNPFSKGYIRSENAYTVRNPQSDLFHLDTSGEDHHSILYDQALLALEQTDYCDFEVQFEVLHNVIHYLVGGRQKFALSSLHYASYDPVFFIHHSFVDKLWVVWQALQKRRKLPYNRADCAVNLMAQSMRPFDAEMNHNDFTKDHAVPNTVFDFENLHYNYDNLDIGGKNLDQLEAEINRRKGNIRVFAGFLLHGIQTSADVHFSICKTSTICFEAGVIFILGGSKEMPWAFDRNYRYDITDTLKLAGISPEAVFDADQPFTIKVEIHAVNNSMLPASTLPAPTIIFSPGEGHEEREHSNYIAGSGVRKDVTSLTASEVENLRHAMAAVMADDGPEGYQAIAAFHGSPPMCEMNGHKVACCAHGMASFPHWHRLFVKQMEDALAHHGSHVGIPYWDWTTAFTEMPALVTDTQDNPFHHGHIGHLDVDTSRSPRDKLFNDPEQGEESFFYRQVLLALEQTDYCQFEVQYELTHNAIHSWTGGSSPYGMSTLEYTAYDPLFWLHHSNTDRIWAIWQALQKYRGLPYNEAHCEIQVLKQPLKPFSSSNNQNDATRTNARPIDSFDYERFNYQYDTLNFHGMSIPELEQLLHERRREERTFAAFLLHGIKKTADVTFDVCKPNGECAFAGTFAVLGGELEMPWSFDRLFRYDITKVLNQLHLHYDSEFSFRVKLVATDGHELASDLIKAPTIEHETGDHSDRHSHGNEDHRDVSGSNNYFRKDIDSLSLDEANDLKNAMFKLQNDDTLHGYEAISGYHGHPNLCPERGQDRYPCCVHGMAIFPHWHRLHTIQLERALREKGARLGVPYWDWTKTMTALPAFFGDSSNNNPFFKYHIRNVSHDTVRAPNNLLFEQPQIHGYDYLYYLALSTLEEDNYCDFEVQYEILHNAVHAWIGGHEMYSMSTLEYSAFDPVFMILHSGLDRLWIIWQELQKLRRKPYNAASCAGSLMDRPLQPFNFESINKDEFTLANSKPSTVFDSHRFGYHYDNLNVRGHSVADLNTIIHDLRNKNRIYAGFVLSGIRTTANVKIYLAQDNADDAYVGSFAVLGGEREMPWAYERIFKYDITDVAEKLGMDQFSTFRFRLELQAYNGAKLSTVLPSPVIIYRPAYHDYDILIIPVGSNQHLPPKVVVKRGTRLEFHPTDTTVNKPVVDLGSYTALFNCIVPPFTFNGYELDRVYTVEEGDYFITGPTRDLCNASGIRIHIHVDDE